MEVIIRHSGWVIRVRKLRVRKLRADGRELLGSGLPVLKPMAVLQWAQGWWQGWPAELDPEIRRSPGPWAHLPHPAVPCTQLSGHLFLM